MDAGPINPRFMQMALDQAGRALAAGEFPVGCVITAGNRAIGGGAREGTLGLQVSETEHAEMIALRHLTVAPGDSTRIPLTIYTTLEPCLMCFGALLLHGISTIVYAYEDVMGGGTRCDLSHLTLLYRQCSLRLVGGVLRRESLALFKAYFSNPNHRYWQNSLLARYTLCSDSD